MQYRLRSLLIPCILFPVTVASFAAHSAANNDADPTGVWTWKFSNQSAIHTLKLKLDGQKLTGTIKNSQSSPESPIEDATFENGSVRFKQTYKTRGGPQAVASYVGTLRENRLKGTIEYKHPDRTLSREWDANRVTE